MKRLRTFLWILVLAGFACAGMGADKKKLVLIAGKPSHGPGAHEHNAGCLLLQKCLKNVPGLEVVVHLNGWPSDESIFDGADAVMIYSDGGGGHPAIQGDRLGFLGKLMQRGVGFGAVHYAVEVPKDRGGKEFLDWNGGYFETFWSVNPHWLADFKELPNHPITRGVKPFEANDEWYYHMRFRENMEGVTPILTAVPPESTRRNINDAHGGNPHVFARKGMPEHVMWARERPDGGRGFGFTGGHNHSNWGNENYRKLILNALLWISKVEVPPNGVESTVTEADLEANLDPKGQRRPRAATRGANVRQALFNSGIVNKGLKEADIDITGSDQLWLVVTDGGDGIGCDWADWVEPRLLKADGSVIKLTDLKWKSAQSGWGQVRVNQNAGGGPLKVGGKSIAYGIGTHSASLIEYDIKGQGFTRFMASVGPDNGGTDQGCGSTVQFMVFNRRPSPALVQVTENNPGANRGSGPEAARDYIETLSTPEGLEATLFASEPKIVNPADMDVDARGRVWITEGANYRRWSNPPLRPEGDRIIILEDTNQDGKAEVAKTFYQDPCVNTALGICVLGNRVIVSSGPHVMVLTDTDGDDKADQRELMFTGISGNQHDHGIHAFVFGPDGKLYFNFGNAGGQLRYPSQKEVPLHGPIPKMQATPVIDLAGNEVASHSKPYREGMVFRCNMDGSEVETLGWNFRNNYEVCVDSFGTLWQSDNDDDGNRGVRINYVMEFGNYGYKDEKTGAGWGEAWNKAKAKGAPESERPDYHWHQSDPGVVPNFRQTGNGSPTGIMVYEGVLLPPVFRNQVLHCDAGPRVVRAYPASPSGAGYSSDEVNLLTSTDSWFRPSDACAGPDGSIYVADWNDPGVGGHNMGDRDLETMRGRVYRVAPPGHKPSAPKLSLQTPRGAVDALQSPNLAVRYLAWTALHSMQRGAEAELLRLWNGTNPRMRARAFHLLARIEGSERDYIAKALKDADPDIRIVGLRTARMLKMNVIPYLKQLLNDRSAAVRRECAIALRHNRSEEAPELWAALALQHDGRDRWYLEALGIAADKQEEAFFSAWLKTVGDNWNTPAGRDIIWRSRSRNAPDLLVQIITDEATTDRERYLRALDFIDGPEKEAALVKLVLAGAGL